MLTDQSIQVDYGNLDINDKKAFDKRLSIKISLLNKHLSSSDERLKIKIQHPGQSIYIVDLNLFDSANIHTSGKGDNVVKALENAFTPLKENLLQNLNKHKEDHEKTPRQHRSALLNKTYGKLKSHIIVNDKETFTKELMPLLKDLHMYIARRLKYAHMVGMDKNHKITVSETLNKTVERAYEGFKNKPIDLSLEHWLFSLADKVLSKDLNEAFFEKQHLEDWDKYVERALADMDENVAISAEGSPEMTEDLDDVEITRNLIPDQLSYELDYSQNITNKERIARILKLIAKLTSLKRSVFTLFAIDGFNSKEIAKIKEVKEVEVDKIINDVREYIRSNI